MKKILVVIIAIVMFTSACMNTMNVTQRMDRGVIVNINNDVVTVKDDNGELWAFTGEGYEVGQRVMIVVDNMGTDNVYDDEVVGVN
jgi:hypothetical protein